MSRRIAGIVLTVVLSFAIGRAQPSRVYDLSNNLIHIEAEDLPYNSRWSLETTNAGYTGRGYLKYVGPELSCWYIDGGGEPVLNDTNGSCQGGRADRLYIPVYIKNTGLYSVNIHGYHTMQPQHFGQTTDFSVWVHMDGKPLPVVVSHLDNAGRWGWLMWGPDYPGRNITTVPVTPAAVAIREPGIYLFYIAGRNRGFCVNRISVYRKLGPTSFPTGCLSTTHSVSTLTDASQFELTAVKRPERVSPAQPVNGARSSTQFDIVGRRVVSGAAAGVRVNAYGQRILY